MNSTLEFFRATQAQPVSTTPSRLTLEQCAGLFDALTGIRVTCAHVLQSCAAIVAGKTLAEAVPHLQMKIDGLPNGKASISRTIRILKLWYRWTHQFHGEQVPDVQAVQSFLVAAAEI